MNYNILPIKTNLLNYSHFNFYLVLENNTLLPFIKFPVTPNFKIVISLAIFLRRTAELLQGVEPSPALEVERGLPSPEGRGSGAVTVCVGES